VDEGGCGSHSIRSLLTNFSNVPLFIVLRRYLADNEALCGPFLVTRSVTSLRFSLYFSTSNFLQHILFLFVIGPQGRNRVSLLSFSFALSVRINENLRPNMGQRCCTSSPLGSRPDDNNDNDVSKMSTAAHRTTDGGKDDEPATEELAIDEVSIDDAHKQLSASSGTTRPAAPPRLPRTVVLPPLSESQSAPSVNVGFGSSLSVPSRSMSLSLPGSTPSVSVRLSCHMVPPSSISMRQIKSYLTPLSMPRADADVVSVVDDSQLVPPSSQLAAPQPPHAAESHVSPLVESHAPPPFFFLDAFPSPMSRAGVSPPRWRRRGTAPSCQQMASNPFLPISEVHRFDDDDDQTPTQHGRTYPARSRSPERAVLRAPGAAAVTFTEVATVFVEAHESLDDDDDDDEAAAPPPDISTSAPRSLSLSVTQQQRRGTVSPSMSMSSSFGSLTSIGSAASAVVVVSRTHRAALALPRVRFMAER
jgi:hypothetical protein